MYIFGGSWGICGSLVGFAKKAKPLIQSNNITT